jgi:hypothetical protein
MNSPRTSSLAAVDPFARRLLAALVRGFHQYATWLVSISWKRFFLLALLLLVLAGMLSNVPPFSWWKRTETVVDHGNGTSRRADAPRGRTERQRADEGVNVNISIDSNGIRTQPPAQAASAAAAAPSAPPNASSRARSDAAAAPASVPDPQAADDAVPAGDDDLRRQITINVPSGVLSDEGRRAIQKAREEIARAIREARDERDERDESPERTRTITVGVDDGLPDFAFFWIVASAIIKITYRGQLRAEARAAVASETAEAETLKRQVVEARMAAMQAQVEPHFLFNTLASIDHLIETDPARASKMQKDLIALLRASMPTMRDGAADGLRDLGSELAMVRPYLEILKVRMDERLDAVVDVPDGLRSAAFPPMMLQSLVENAIKHGLEPKPEGGSLRVKAEVIDGALVVSVRDSGLGFGAAATQGTGVGLANIRERLQLLYGRDARLDITANVPSGTIATVTVPYRSQATGPKPAPGAPRTSTA